MIGPHDGFIGAILLVFCGAPLAFTLLFALALWHRRVKRRNNPPEVRCRRCGYSLRMLTVPRCPECGLEFWT